MLVLVASLLQISTICIHNDQGALCPSTADKISASEYQNGIISFNPDTTLYISGFVLMDGALALTENDFRSCTQIRSANDVQEIEITTTAPINFDSLLLDGVNVRINLGQNIIFKDIKSKTSRIISSGSGTITIKSFTSYGYSNVEFWISFASVETTSFKIVDPYLQSIAYSDGKAYITGINTFEMLDFYEKDIIIETDSSEISFIGEPAGSFKGTIKISILTTVTVAKNFREPPLIICKDFKNINGKYIITSEIPTLISRTNGDTTSHIVDQSSVSPMYIKYPRPSFEKKYCVSSVPSTMADMQCTDGSIITYYQEIRLLFVDSNPHDSIEFSLNNFVNETKLPLNLSTMVKKNFALTSYDNMNKQKVYIFADHNTDASERSQRFTNISLLVYPLSYGTDLNFQLYLGSVSFIKCDLTGGQTIQSLQANAQFCYNCKKITIDTETLSTKLATTTLKTSDDFVVLDGSIKKCVFDKTGNFVTLYATNPSPVTVLQDISAQVFSSYVPNDKPLILQIPTDSENDIEFDLQGDTNSKLLDFRINIEGASVETVKIKYTGKGWEGKSLILDNGGKNVICSFDPKTSSGPEMMKTGKGGATLNGEEIQMLVPSTTKPSGLSGGEIAGIAVAGIVMIAAVAIIVVLVVQHRKKLIIEAYSNPDLFDPTH